MKGLKFLPYIFMTIVILTSCGGNTVTGEVNDPLFILEKNCGCSSTNSEQKRKDLYEKFYQNKLITVNGEVKSIEDELLTLDCFNHSRDIRITFESADDLYELKVGSLVRVKFALRELDDLFCEFTGDLGEIVSTNQDEIIEIAGKERTQQEKYELDELSK
jgi:hypothetical protein